MNAQNNLLTILAEIRTNNGVTAYHTPLALLDDCTSKLKLNTHKTGYAVGDNNHSQTIDKLGEHNNEALAQLGVAIYDLWESKPSAQCVGFWLDSNTNTLYVDAVDVVENLAEAMNLGASRNELAIWDISMAREIRL